MSATILPRRGTAAQWSTANPILASGERGFETNTGRWKTGDGTTTYSLLPYDDDPLKINGSTTSGRAVLTGTAAAGRAALGAVSSTEVSATVAASMTPTSVTYSNGFPATETIPLATGGNLVKTYHYDGSGNPTTCDWNFPTGTDYVETFTYDGTGNATGSTFAEA